ncbi:MAG: alpha/beta hydrolase, partial [Acidimicrobiia bacterium]
MLGPTSHTYYSQRLRLHYLDYGNADAPPLLMVHGNRDHAHNWDWLADRLRDRYHIVAPDLRGHGDSQWSLGSAYATNEFVYDIAQLVEQQRLAPLRIVAHSLGGNVALRYAGTYPDRVERLVVIEGSAGTIRRVDPPPPAAERLQKLVDTGRSLAARTPRRYATLDDAFRRMLE